VRLRSFIAANVRQARPIARNPAPDPVPSGCVFVGLLMMGVAATALARPAADISVEGHVAGTRGCKVTARALLHVPAELIWQTLTDYEHLPNFVPDIAFSRVVSRQGAQLVIEQRGDVRLWFFSYPIRVTVASTERPYHGIDVPSAAGQPAATGRWLPNRAAA